MRRRVKGKGTIYLKSYQVKIGGDIAGINFTHEIVNDILHLYVVSTNPEKVINTVELSPAAGGTFSQTADATTKAITLSNLKQDVWILFTGVRELKLTETIEYITKVGTSTWTVPAGCYSVDAFVVNGGHGGAGASPSQSAYGGAGGATNSYYNLSVTPGQVITVAVGAGGAGASGRGLSWDYREYNVPGEEGKASYFMNSSYTGMNRVYGGASGPSGGTEALSGNPGRDGFYAFDDATVDGIKYGASGGGGATTGLPGMVHSGGWGGNKGGGQGGSSGGATQQIAWYGGHASSASNYGGGGGGGGKGQQNAGIGGNGGKGYQGVVILRYQKYQ